MQLFAIKLVLALSSHIYRLFFQDGCSPTWSFRSSNGAPIATIIQYLYLAAVLLLLFSSTFLSIAHPWRELDLHIMCAKSEKLSLILWALGENVGLICSFCLFSLLSLVFLGVFSFASILYHREHHLLHQSDLCRYRHISAFKYLFTGLHGYPAKC